MESDTWRATATRPAGRATRPSDPDLAAAEAAVTAIYQAHALGLIRLAHKPGRPAKAPHSGNAADYGIEFGVLNGNRFAPLPGAPRPGFNPWPIW